MTDSFDDGIQHLQALAKRAGTPIGVHLQVADRCNHACKHCYQVQGEKGELTFGQLMAVLDDLAESGILMLNVSGGEATLRDDLPEILDAARARGFAVRLYTNAYALDDRLADRIAAAQVLEVHVSVYSDQDDEHDAVTRVSGSLNRTLAGIARLRDRGLRVVIKTPMMAHAPGASARVGELAKAMGCQFKTSVEITPREDGSLEPKAMQMPPDSLLAESNGLKPWQPSRDHESEARARLASPPCHVCSASVAVMPNGEVRPCTDTIVPLGNLTRDKFRDIYRTSAAASMIRAITWNDVHGCRDCDLLLACHRCHASAAHESGDYLGPYRTGCAVARARYAAAVGTVEIMPPDADCDPGRDRNMGPYRIESAGRLRPIRDRQSEIDAQRAAEFPWIRADREYMKSMLGGAPETAMVPLRRSRGGASLAPSTLAGPGCTDS